MDEETGQNPLSGSVANQPSGVSSQWASILSLASSVAALGITFYALLQLDFPIVRYVRVFTTHRAGEQLTVPWMAWTSEAGDWIGDGFRLLVISAVLLAIGWSRSKPYFKQTGIETLVAHGLAALGSNGLKHLLGRPRPKFVHSGEWQFSPSWTSGLDSFPSGHTTASFAIAAVLAKRFPALGPFCFSVAAFVGLSRVIRGSHFPTDVFGGAVLGIVCGSLAAAPWRAWRFSLEEGLRHAAIGAAALLAVLWSLSHPADGGMTGKVWLGMALVSMLSGFWLRRVTWSDRDKAPTVQEKVSTILIAYGLACLTTSPFVIAAVGLASLAYWINLQPDSAGLEPRSQIRTMLAEGVLLACVLLALSILIEGRGALPF